MSNSIQPKVDSFQCDQKCCSYKISPYKNVKFNSNIDWKSNTKIVKAGSFIVDPSTSKILLVQSRGQMWGPPKGTIQDDESYEECAIREVFEETGITLNVAEFIGYTIIKNKAIYYTTELKEDEITPQNHIKDNDANGIGWFNINCLNNLIREEKIKLNQHCKILIKKFFGKYIF
jgi:ADP-ribose pyrophosphatase YjhB (NUDIX family)